ncbi:hypothetical protein [Pandoraea sp. NPDC087047]|uniref:hypothetical protein n=1 Tax=Pandoraea sp. NPDC087047 TaxID=3364390 RepID=UPI0037FB910E
MVILLKISGDAVRPHPLNKSDDRIGRLASLTAPACQRCRPSPSSPVVALGYRLLTGRLKSRGMFNILLQRISPINPLNLITLIKSG